MKKLLFAAIVSMALFYSCGNPRFYTEHDVMVRAHLAYLDGMLRHVKTPDMSADEAWATDSIEVYNDIFH